MEALCTKMGSFILGQIETGSYVQLISSVNLLCIQWVKWSSEKQKALGAESDVRERQKRESSRDQGNRQPAHTLLSVGRWRQPGQKQWATRLTGQSGNFLGFSQIKCCPRAHTKGVTAAEFPNRLVEMGQGQSMIEGTVAPGEFQIKLKGSP